MKSLILAALTVLSLGVGVANAQSFAHEMRRGTSSSRRASDKLGGWRATGTAFPWNDSCHAASPML